MAKHNYSTALKLVLAHEGGYVNHPKDPGGATMKGVTQKVYDGYRKLKGLPKRSVREIEQAELAEIYEKNYWDAVSGNLLPAGVDYAVFDYAVNSGPSRATKDLQRTVNAWTNKVPGLEPIGVDSDFGPATLEGVIKCANFDEVGFIESLCDRRMSFMRSLKTFPTFGKGWTRRVLGDNPYPFANDGDNGVIDYAVQMARDDLEYPVKLPTPIGAKQGEEPAKATEASVSVLKTPEGVGGTVAAVGATGATAFQAADAVKAHIDDSTFGKMAAVIFGLLMLAGVAIVLYNFFEKRKEKAA